MSETAAPATGTKARRDLDRAVIRFAGDSGDGMQLTGEQFTTESAWAGNDLATLPKVAAHRKRMEERPAVQKVLADLKA